MLPAGSLEAEELRFQATCRQHRGCIISSCKHSLVLLKMGEIIARNMLSWLELLINRYCCIKFVYIACINDAWSNKYHGLLSFTCPFSGSFLNASSLFLRNSDVCVHSKLARESPGVLVCNLNSSCPQRNIQCNYVIEPIHQSQRTNVFRNNSELPGLTTTTQTWYIITCVAPAFHCKFFSL